MKDFYGRRSSRGLKIKDLSLLKNHSFFLREDDFLEKLIFFKKKFSDFSLEIGFGLGENLFSLATKELTHGFIGCDPFIKGNIRVCKHIDFLQLKNILITDMTFQYVLNFFKHILFSNIYILFPDPWPKEKHAKRRLVNPSFIQQLSMILKYKGSVILITDDLNYQKEILLSFSNNKCFKEQKLNYKLKDIDLQNIFVTKYYKKAISKKKNIYRNLFELTNC